MPSREQLALALQLLGGTPDARVRPISRLDATELIRTDPPGTRTRAWAVRRNGQDEINVPDWTEEKDNRALAALIAHEQFHLDTKSSDEGPAYQKQLEVLESLRAPAAEVSRVRNSQRRIAPGYKVLRSRALPQFGLPLKDVGPLQ